MKVTIIYIYIYIEIFIKFHDGNLFMADKMNFCEGTSLSFWESIQEEYKNSQKYYMLSNKHIISLKNQINSKKCIKEEYESIKKYLKGEELNINSSNYSYLLSFAYYEKIQKLREICNKGQKNIFIKEQIEKLYFHSHFDSIYLYNKNNIYLVSDCILNHRNPLSTIYCNKCDKVVCIDCHLFSFYKDKEHKEAIKQILKNLQNTHPITDQPHLSGFYVYTDVLNTMNPNIMIDTECIAIIPKKNYLLKIMRVYNTKGNGEFVLKQIIPIKNTQIVEKEIKSARNEYELMDKMKAFSILSYHYGSNENAVEMLMEYWGKPLNEIDFWKLKEKELFQIIREYCGALETMNYNGIYHGDIKMENIILNEQSYIPKFIDYGISSKLPREELFLIRTTTINENNWEHLKGWTSYMAPTELLQYLNNEEDKSRIITYCLSKIDVFCLGFTLFCMITQSDYQYMKKLQDLRSSIQTEKLFYIEIKNTLAKSLSSLPWNKEFKSKLEQIILLSLQLVELRPNALEFFTIIQLFDTLPINQYISLCQTATTDQSTKIQKLISFNSLNVKIINICHRGIEYEKGLKLCSESEIILKDIFGEDYYKNTREYMIICECLGKLLNQKCDYARSREYRERAIKLGEQLLTPIHPTLFRLYNELGGVLGDLGLYEEAENMRKKTLNLYKQLYGDKVHPDVATSYNNLGFFYDTQCKYELAKENYTQALNQRLEIFGDKPHKHIASSYNNLGSLYDEIADYKTAEVFYNKSLAINKQLYEEKAHPHIATSYNNLGTFYINQSNYKKAEEMLIMALNQYLELFGNNPHSDVAHSYHNLGGAYEHQGKYKEGEIYYLKALNIRKQIHGERAHPHVVASYNNLGALYDSQEDYKRAEEMHIKSLNLNLELYGKDKPHAHVSTSYNGLGGVYYNLGDYKRAEEYYKKALNIDIQIHGEKDHPDIATGYDNLGSVYYSQGDIIRAEEMYTKALEQQLRIFGNNTPHEAIARSYNNLGMLYYEQMGDYERALQYLTKTADMIYLIHQQDNSHPLVLVSLNNLAGVMDEYKNSQNDLGYHLYESFIKSLASFGYLNGQTQYKMNKFNEYYSAISIHFIHLFHKYIFYIGNREREFLLSIIPGIYIT